MGNLSLDQLAASQSAPEVTVNNATDKLDKALTEALAVDLTNDVTLTNSQYRGNIYFNVSTAGTGKKLTLPAIKRMVFIRNTSTNNISVAVGSTSVPLSKLSAGMIALSDGTTNGLSTVLVDKALPTGGSTNQALTMASGTDYDWQWATVQTLPTGGTAGQALTKIDSTDFNVQWATIPALPSGGTTNQVLTKQSNTNYDFIWAAAGAATNGLPVGGSTGNMLRKASGTDFDTAWIAGIPTGGSTGQALKKNSGTDFDMVWGAAASAPLNEAAYTVPPTATSGYDSNVTSAAGLGDAWSAGGVGSNTQILAMGSASASTNSNVSGVFKNITSSGAGGASGWRLTCKFRLWYPQKGSGAAGIVLSDGTKYYIFGLGNTGFDNCKFVKYTFTTASGGTVASSALNTTGAASPGPEGGAAFWARVWDDKTNRKLQFSWDGNKFITALSEARTTFLTHTKVGWGAMAGNTADGWTATDMLFECHSFLYEDLP